MTKLKSLVIKKSNGAKTVIMGRFPLLGELGGVAEAAACVNLRRDSLSGGLRLAPAPEAEAWPRPLATMEPGSQGESTLMLDEDMKTLRVKMADGSVARAGTLSGTFLCCAKRGPGSVLVSTTSGCEMVETGSSGAPKLMPRGHLLPMLRFEAYSEMRLTMPVEERKLSRSYDLRASALTAADTDALSADLLRAYEELHYAAEASGYCMQPVLARYRLEGAGGETLFVSAPVAVTASTGLQCMDEMSVMLSADRGSRNGFSVGADLFKIRLRTVPNYNSSAFTEVARLVVETTAAIHPVDFGRRCAGALSREGTDSMRLRMFMPGASVTMAKAGAMAAGRLAGALCHGNMLFREVASVNCPFVNGSEITVEIGAAGLAGATAKEQAEALAAVLSKRVEPMDRIAALTRPPHRVSASAIDVSGESVVMADIRPIAYQGYPAEHFAASLTDEAVRWRASVEVTTADGRRLTAVGGGLSRAPLTLSPVLYFPMADAVEMTVRVERDGATYGFTAPLRPTPDGAGAYYASHTCRPIALEPMAGVEVAESPETPDMGRYPAALLAAPLSDPLMVADAARIPAGRIVAVKATDRRGGAWDYSMRRVFVFATTGVMLANLTRAGEWGQIHPFDGRGVASASDVVATTDDRYQLVYRSGDELLGLTKGSLSTLSPLPYYHLTDALAEVETMRWDARRRELIVPAGDCAKVYALGLCDESDDAPRAPEAYFEYEMALRPETVAGTLRRGHAKALAMEIDFTGSAATIEVRAGDRTMTRCHLRKSFSGRIYLKLLPIPAADLRIALSGRATRLKLHEAEVVLA